MSLYVQWQNLIKEKSCSDWLTDGQRQAYLRVLDGWAAHPFVNLYGPVGCGKSFVSRLLAKEHGYLYLHDLQTAPDGSSNVIVDDVEYSRLMRATAQLRYLGRVILVTRRPTTDPMPRAEIRLSERDLNQFLHNLYAYCNVSFVHTNPEGTDLGKIIRDEAIARGGYDAA